jgi:hypothetical protein
VVAAWLVYRLWDGGRLASQAATEAGRSDQAGAGVGLCKPTSSMSLLFIPTELCWTILLTYAEDFGGPSHVIICACLDILQWRPDNGYSQHGVYFDHDSSPDNQHWGWSWLERWMAARPWENRMLDSRDGRKGKPHSFSHETESVTDSNYTPPAAPKTTKVASSKGSIHGSVRDYSSFSGSIRTSPTRSRGCHSFQNQPSTTSFDKQVHLQITQKFHLLFQHFSGSIFVTQYL